MKKSILSAAIALTLSAANFALADQTECCASGAAHKNMTAMCEATYAKLNLSAEQKAKMDKLAAECDKGGCTKDSMTRMEAKAKNILTRKQFAAWKAACSAHATDKTQS